MTRVELLKWYFLTSLKAILSIFDLLAILAIGFVATSTATFLIQGSSPDRVLDFAGLQLPAVTAQTLPWVMAAVLALFLTKALLSVLLTKKAAFFVATVEARSARTIAEISFGGDLGEARRRSREEVMFAIQVGSPRAFNVLLNAVNSLLTETALFLLICISFLFVDPWNTLAAVTYFVLIAFVMHYFVGSLMSREGKVSAEGALKANAEISDLLSVFRELLVLGKRQKYIQGIFRARVMAADSEAKLYYLAGMPRYILEAALLVGVGLFVLAQALAGDLIKSASTIGVFLAGGFRLTAALLPLQSALLTIKGSVAPAMTAHEILKVASDNHIGAPPQIRDKIDTGGSKDRSQPISPIGIRCEDVSFSYPGSLHPAVTNVSFEILAGSQVALIGPSGAGKSTIADLLCTALTPSSGSISQTEIIGGLSNLGVGGRVSYVPQRPGLVSGTILDNVALGEYADNIDRDQALEALRLAHLGDLIKKLPNGLDTPLGKLKDGLSGGQMQRLGLARALYTKPGLLVMDEATSSLDAESEAQIHKALNEMRGKVTVVLIAHRLHTIQHADKVILVEGGQVSDSGTLKELMARNSSVRRVVKLMKVDQD